MDTYATEPDGTHRQWAAVEFVPSEPGENKQSLPWRHVGLRLLKAQGSLFAGGSDRHHYAVLTNPNWKADRLLKWHRETAGSHEHVHDEVRNALGGGHMPSRHFAANAAWFKLSLLASNLASATKGPCFSAEERTVCFKRYRLMVVHPSGRMSRFANTLRLRLCASVEAIARLQRIWEVFILPPRARANESRPEGRELFAIRPP